MKQQNQRSFVVTMPGFTAESSFARTRKRSDTGNNSNARISNRKTLGSNNAPVVISQQMDTVPGPCEWYRIVAANGEEHYGCGYRKYWVYPNGQYIPIPLSGWTACPRERCGRCPVGYCDCNDTDSGHCAGKLDRFGGCTQCPLSL